MPTFKNETSHYIDYEQETGGKKNMLRFKPDEERALPFWLPYQQLGLTLISADYPAVPNTVLISGNFNFDEGTERKFNIEPCDDYALSIIVQSGKIALYHGNSPVSVEVAENIDVPYHYRAKLEWEYAPYLRVVGLENGTTATIHAEIEKGR